MSKENSDRILPLQQEVIRLSNLRDERVKLADQIGLGAVQYPAREGRGWRKIIARIDGTRARVSHSALVFEQRAARVQSQLNQETNGRFIPLPIAENKLLGLLTVATDENATVQSVQEVAGLERSRNGRVKLGWPNVKSSLERHASYLYIRVSRLDGRFATEDENCVWEEIRQAVTPKDANPLTDLEVLRAFRDVYLPNWFDQRKPAKK